MKRSRLFLALSLFLIACSDEKAKDPITETKNTDTVIATEPAIHSVKNDTIPQNIQVDSVIHLQFPADSNTVTARGHLDKRGDPVICLLPVKKGRKLTATVVAEEKKSTIRFSHLYFPDGTSDGPFGAQLKHDLKGEGLYKLYISPNKMAGDPMSTDFTLTVKVQ